MRRRLQGADYQQALANRHLQYLSSKHAPTAERNQITALREPVDWAVRSSAALPESAEAASLSSKSSRTATTPR